MEDITLIHGDCLKEMTKLKPNSIDTIITDPPYGIGFMGKEWDTFKPENVAKEKKRDTLSHKRRELRGDRPRPSAAMAAARYDFSRNAEFQTWFTVWGKEALRVLKPGGTLLIFGGTRTYHRIACAIEDAGLVLKDCIMWLFGSGFPKATDISQMLDKDECRKQLEKKFNRKPTKKEFKKEWEGFRKKIGKGKRHNSKEFGGEKYGEYKGGVSDITAPTTSQAKLWNGWKSHGLKPAYEPIIVAMKPNDGSCAENALKHGVAGLNIDGGRIGIDIKNEPDTGDSYYLKRGKKYPNKGSAKIMGQKSERVDITMSQGRFPANIILDEEAAEMLDEQSGARPAGNFPKRRGKTAFFGLSEAENRSPFVGNIGDMGGASRFFYVAKASKAERNMGCGERNMGCGELNFIRHADRKKVDGVGGDNPRNRTNTSKQNFHPTVKPLKLMEYLCRLTKTPSGGIVLDPFMGSGTTGMACKITKRKFIGIEKEKEYYEIARKRIQATQKTFSF